MADQDNYLPKPEWLKIRLPRADEYKKIKSTLGNHLHTICESGMCPNIAECWGMGTATFMILGNTCSRNCKFCAVLPGKPEPVNPEEPSILSDAVRTLKLKHVVLTSVTRDDLPDEGAGHWAACIRRLHEDHPNVTVEVLVPDFHARKELIALVVSENPYIYSHNLETVRRLTSVVRSVATYDTSLESLRIAKEMGMLTKSGIMVGLGETREEIEETIRDIRNAGCDLITIGQYLQPTRKHHPVQRYYTPQEFSEFKEFALSLGFKHVESGPLVRSSYHSKPLI